MSESPDAKASVRLAETVGRVVSNTKVERVAGMGYMQAVLSQAAVQALINLLKTKNIVSDAELARFLAEQYDERSAQLAGRHGGTPAAAPLVRAP